MFTKAFRIGNDPQVRFTQKGDAVLSLSLAYSYGRKGDDGKKPTQWLEATLWGKQAEALQQYLTKGSQIVATVDDLHIEEYEGKNGAGHKLAGKIVGLEFVGSRQQAEPAQASRTKQAQAGDSGFDDMDDDIPF